jgi:hypothetical protein
MEIQERQIERLTNEHSKENGNSGTPDRKAN